MEGSFEGTVFQRAQDLLKDLLQLEKCQKWVSYCREPAVCLL